MAKKDTNRLSTPNHAADRNLYVFCIGGSGLRVFRSLIMTLASGYRIDNYRVCPYLVDPHLQSEELTEVADLIDRYTKVYKDENEGFFSTQISADLTNLNVMESERISTRSFGDFIGKSSYTPESPEAMLIDMLYSKQNLETSMSVGFKGSPNVGSVVFQDFIHSKWFDRFNPTSEDKVLLVGSLFGGTGASGIPAIASAIKAKNANVKVGVISLIPYYELLSPRAGATHHHIDSRNFEPKSSAAIRYYINRSENFDRFYVFGDSVKKRIPYDEEKQGNAAHFIEFAAALAAKDFAETPDDNFSEANKWNCFVIETNNGALDYDSVGEGARGAIHCLGDFYSLAKCFFLMQTPVNRLYPLYRAFRSDFSNADFDALSSFLYSEQEGKYSFIRWLGEMTPPAHEDGNNGRTFKAIDTHDISAPDEETPVGHFRFLYDDNFHLFNKDSNPYAGNTIISRQFLKMNDAFRKSFTDTRLLSSITRFLNAAYEGIRDVNVPLF